MIYQGITGEGPLNEWRAATNGKWIGRWFLTRNNNGKREDYTKADGTMILFTSRVNAMKKAAKL